MKNVQVSVNKYSELSEAAKEKARAWYVSGDNFDAENVIEDFTTIAEMLGFYDVEVSYSGFSSQGDGASFTGRYKYAKGTPAAIKAYAPGDAELLRIALGLQTLQRAHFYQLRAVLSSSSNYSHENTVSFEVFDARDEYRDIGTADDDFSEKARDLMRWLYKQLEREYDYRMSDEYAENGIIANDYDFLINGEVY